MVYFYFFLINNAFKIERKLTKISQNLKLKKNCTVKITNIERETKITFQHLFSSKVENIFRENKFACLQVRKVDLLISYKLI